MKKRSTKTLIFCVFMELVPLLAQAKTEDLTPGDVQILFADMQPPLVSQSLTVSPKRIAEAALALAKVARILKIPMTFAIVPFGGKPGVLIPELVPYATEKTTFSRTTMSPFLEPRLVSAIDSNNRRTLIIVGYSTEVAVLQSTLGALNKGYAVQVAVDGIGSLSARTEQAALNQIEKAGGITTCVLSLATALAPEFTKPPGSLTFEAIKPLLTPEPH